MWRVGALLAGPARRDGECGVDPAIRVHDTCRKKIILLGLSILGNGSYWLFYKNHIIL